MKRWTLDSHQRVCVDSYRNVHFVTQHHHCTFELILTWRQFQNLNDVLMDLAIFKRMKYYPLGKNLWLEYNTNHIQLYHCRHKHYFRFSQYSFIKYKRKIHQQVMSFLRHDVSELHRRQHAAAHATLQPSRSRRTPQSSTQQQTLSRPTSNARCENEQRAKPPNLSKRERADTRCPFSFVGAVDALGAAAETATDMEEGDVCHIQVDCGESCDFDTTE